jgi:phosphoglycerol transferase MdoB-like AlkP superfamily enzyme
MLPAAPVPRTTKIFTIIAAIGFFTLLVFGPVLEASLCEQLFSIALVLDAVLLVAFATRRPAFAMALPSVLFGGVLVASALKFHYLTTPLLAPDLIYFVNRDLIDVAGRYPPIMASLILGVIAIPGLLIVAWRLDRPRLFAFLSPSRRRSVQVLGVVATIALALTFDSPEGPFPDVFEKGMWQTMNDKSYISDFFASFYQTQIKIPAVAADADTTVTWEQTANDNPPTCIDKDCSAGEQPKIAQEHPDVISVLEESTFDPTTLKVCTLPLCKQKMFQPDGRTRASGWLHVHTWGGGTWTSEFALLSGLAHDSFGDAGLYAPYNLAPRISDSLPKVLHESGYRVIAIYPMSGDFINARNAYKFYGFDSFYDGQDYGLSWESSDNDLMQVFDRIYDDEKKKIGKQPLFVMLLTLRQHGPHMTPLNKLPPPYNQPLFPGKFAPKALDEWLNLNLGNYLSRLIGSDAAISHLEKKLLDGERPALLFHFGDHQPSFDGAIRDVPKQFPKFVADPNFETYYMLKTNYRPARKYSYPELDLSFAAGLILDVAGVKKDTFFQANALLRERCNGVYLVCAKKPVLDSYHNYIFQKLGAVHE